MSGSISPEAVVVSEASFHQDEAEAIVLSNISFLNALFAEHLTEAEVAPNALRSYYVDYFLAQLENGGFSQFVYNSRWAPPVVQSLREGLQAIAAEMHLAAFEAGATLVEQLGPERLATFLESDYFDDNEERDFLDEANEELDLPPETEDLRALNASWLKQLPDLVVLPAEALAAEVRRRGQALPDREERAAAARANEPRYMQLIRALCERSGQELNRVTAGDPSHEHEGARTVAWHFLTDQGHHYMVDADGLAIMFRGDSSERVCEIEAPAE